jgi:Uma2 family endonuclease
MTEPETLTPPRPSLRMSEAEYERWALSQERCEWVDGEVVLKMSVSEDQDEIQALMMTVIRLIVERRKLGRVYGANFTTRLKLPNKIARRDPDVMFVSNESASVRHKTYLEGPPDLAVEVVGPESQFRDFHEKFAEYEEAGVREYWIVSPLGDSIDLFVRDATNKFARRDPDAEGRFHSIVIAGLWFDPKDLFAAERPNAITLLKKIDPSLLA